ncbi:MAG: DUF4126 domain-containing protein [Vicinamibacterales bacterium]|nr:DUF4126 domain-containing protein [Vicinamibacterales bacterium]
MELSGETLLSLGLGIGLAAACGFRVFVPLLVLSVASRYGYVPLAGGWEWIASTPATIAFASATVLEVAGYYIPWFDHLLDTVATPAAVIAGMVTSASILGDLPPLLKWTAIVIGGGGAAAIVQGSTVALRAGSGAMTAGIANPVVASVELFGATATAILAILLPLVALLVAVGFILAIYRLSRRLVGGRRATT